MDIEEKAKADLWERYRKEESRDRARKPVPNFLLSKLADPKSLTVARYSEP